MIFHKPPSYPEQYVRMLNTEKSLSWGSLSLMIDLICSFLVLRPSHIDFYNIIYKGFSENVESVKKLVSTQKLEQIWGRILWDLIWICVMSLDLKSVCRWCLPPKKWDVKKRHTYILCLVFMSPINPSTAPWL